MKFYKFTILKSNEAYQQQDQVELIINVDHLVSVKPIKMTTADRDVIDGYWLRLTNGKKYKATSIPAEIAKVFEEETLPVKYATDASLEDLGSQVH